MFEGNSCGVFSSIHEQSADINRGVDGAAQIDPMNQGAGDQGMMFGYATNETENYMPLALDLAHGLLLELADIRREGTIPYLRPDAKSQVTIEYDDNNKPIRIDTIVISTQHDDFIKPANDSNAAIEKADSEMLAKIRKDIIEILIPRVKAKQKKEVIELFDGNITYHVNPTGKFVIGGPHGDTGLTGRKIIVDTYGGKGAHGGGAFSGKDPSKVDRSGAYAARHIAKNLVAAGVADEVLVQVSYAIGVAKPMNLYINTYGTSKLNITDGELSKKMYDLFDMRPKAIENRLKLRNPIYSETASYGHMGREPKTVVKTFKSRYEGEKTIKVELFTWEKLDFVDKIKQTLGLK
jgi:S-adenosylmethionine synthetase